MQERTIDKVWRRVAGEEGSASTIWCSVLSEDTAPEGRGGAREAEYASARVFGVVTFHVPILNRDSRDNGSWTFSGVEAKRAVRLSGRALAVDDAEFRTAGLRAERDGLSQEIDVAIAIAGEDAISEFDHISIDSKVNRGLNGREVPSAIWIHDVRRSEGRSGHCEGRDDQKIPPPHGAPPRYQVDGHRCRPTAL